MKAAMAMISAAAMWVTLVPPRGGMVIVTVSGASSGCVTSLLRTGYGIERSSGEVAVIEEFLSEDGTGDVVQPRG